MVSVFSVSVCEARTHVFIRDAYTGKLWSKCQTVNIRVQASSHQYLCYFINTYLDDFSWFLEIHLWKLIEDQYFKNRLVA